MGNEPPVVDFAITKGNTSFFFPDKTIEYTVNVRDKEDGSLSDKKISPALVSVSANYLSEGYNPTAIAQQQIGVDASVQQYATAIGLINRSDCRACHSVKEKMLGPSFTEVALKYKGDLTATNKLAKKITAGGAGVWGDAMMPAHPNMVDADAKAIVKYILSLSKPPRLPQTLPVSGSYTTAVPKDENSDRTFIFRASYTDKATKTAAAHKVESVILMHNPLMPIQKAAESFETSFNTDSTNATIRTPGGWLKFSKVDLSGVRVIEVKGGPASGGQGVVNGVVEAFLGSPMGKSLGKFSGNYNMPGGVKIPIPDDLGVTDLYIVFNGSSMRVNAVRFSLR